MKKTGLSDAVQGQEHRRAAIEKPDHHGAALPGLCRRGRQGFAPASGALPQKARRGDDDKILRCNPKCDACFQLVMKGRPAICPQWPKEKRSAYRENFH